MLLLLALTPTWADAFIVHVPCVAAQSAAVAADSTTRQHTAAQGSIHSAVVGRSFVGVAYCLLLAVRVCPLRGDSCSGWQIHQLRDVCRNATRNLPHGVGAGAATTSRQHHQHHLKAGGVLLRGQRPTHAHTHAMQQTANRK
jgi:hypothetical protein